MTESFAQSHIQEWRPRLVKASKLSNLLMPDSIFEYLGAAAFITFSVFLFFPSRRRFGSVGMICGSVGGTAIWTLVNSPLAPHSLRLLIHSFLLGFGVGSLGWYAVYLIERAGAGRFLAWPSIVAMFSVALFAVAVVTPGPAAFGFVLIIAALTPIVVIGLVVALVYFLWKRRLHAALTGVLAPTLCVVLAFPLARLPAQHVHFLVTRHLYDAQVTSLRGTPGHRFGSFDWSTGFAGGPSTFLIFDESDKIALPMQKHTADRQEEQGFADSCAGQVQHLQGHYYVCTF
jgi:hypothetical protein